MDPDKLFEYISLIFDKNSNWDSVKRSHKNKHHFMLSRFLSIQFPIQANEFNRMEIDPVSVADYWHYQLGKSYNKVPPWMYTKTKSAKAEKTKDYIPSSEVQKFWMKLNLTTKLDYDQMMKFFPEDFKEELENLEAQLKLM